MNLYAILGALLLAAGAGNAFQWYQNDVLTLKLAAANKSLASASANETHNADAAKAWQQVGVNLATQLNECYAQDAAHKAENEAALTAANKTAADTAARLVVWQQHFAKLAKSGPIAQLMSTKLPDEVLP